MTITKRDFLIGGGCGIVGAAIGAVATNTSFSGGPSVPLDVNDYRELARNRLSRAAYDFLDGGSDDEKLLVHNRAVFDRLRFKSSRLTDVSKRDLTTEIFGKKQAAPVLIAPTGLNGILWPDGDIALARAAEKAGIPFLLSTASSTSIEDVARSTTGDKWFQLYVMGRGVAESLVERAKNAGYTKLVLTTDVGVNGNRERDKRNGFGVPIKYTPSLIMDGIAHPRWSLDLLMNGVPELANFVSSSATDTASQAAVMNRQMDTTFSWSDIAWLRNQWPHELIIKGILNPDDAVRCFDEGADGIVLSNHGGRQLDSALSPLQVLSATRERVSGTVLIDSGYRRGSDIVKALALGANGVLLGKATLYGLAARGEAGATDVLNILFNEISNVLAQIGCPAVSQLIPDYLVEDDLPLLQQV